MTITIKFQTDSAAFTDDLIGEFLAVLNRCEDNANGSGLAIGDIHQLHDTNGNHVGTFSITK